MTSASVIPAAGTGTEVCRVTVVGPGGRADLAIPVTLPLAALLPVLVEHVVSDVRDRGTPWSLQRLGEPPLDPDGTPDALGLHHGDVLHLRPVEEPLPTLHFDDIADGVAHVVGALPGRWRPELTRALALTMAALATAFLALALLSGGPGDFAGYGAGAAAVVLTAAAVTGARFTADPAAVLTGGIAALAMAALAGLSFRTGPGGGFDPGVPGLLVTAGCVTAVAVALVALRATPFLVPGTAAVVAAATAATLGVRTAFDWRTGQAVAVAGVALFVLGHFAPRITLRAARLRVPQLPHNAAELQEDVEPEPQERVERRVRAATSYLDALSIGFALCFGVVFWFMVHEHGWIGWALPLVFGAAVLLRSRGLTGTLQRVPTVIAAGGGLALLLLQQWTTGGTGHRGVAVALLLLTVVALLAAAWRLPTGRLLPVWGHSGDITEMLVAMALLPLLLQLLHVYARLREMTS
ncbi:type VII secretion integral membrane protein EccD [Actinacidiphila sp. bgisy145]|uniref:type VII secretion integral membrane protein EccD n=1 Tax=Actinacidiphila sp. bgisy145 TaxID=3413792 RepID=UPI003EC072C4